jgi:outer membrane immunogenic protein
MTMALAAITCLSSAAAGAGPKLIVALEDGSGLIGGPAANKAGAAVTVTPLNTDDGTDRVITVGTTDASGRAVLEVPRMGAYSVLIRADGTGGPRYWSTRKILLDAETQLLPGGLLSTDEFGPIKDYGEVSCRTAGADADLHALREILSGRIPVLEMEISDHRGEAAALVRTGFDDAPAAVRDAVTAAVESRASAAQIYQTLTPLRQSHGLPNRGVDVTGRFPEESVEPNPVPKHAWAIETIWLLYFLATQAELDLETLQGNLRECDEPDVAAVPPQDEDVFAPDYVYPDPVRRRPDSAPTASQTSSPDWSGLYVGAHAGAGIAPADYRAGSGGLNIPMSIDADGAIGGVLVGYNLHYDRMLIGLEGDVSFGRIEGGNTLAGFSDPRMQAEFIATVRARAGYLWDRVLIFATAGIGYAQAEIKETLQIGAQTTKSNGHIGFVVGGGLEWALSETVRLRTEYAYANFNRRSYTIGPASDSLAFDIHTIRAAISVNLGH